MEASMSARLCGVPGCQEVANVCAPHFGSANAIIADLRAEIEQLRGERNSLAIGYEARGKEIERLAAAGTQQVGE